MRLVALTGTTGFVGGHLLERARASGASVRALVRHPKPAVAETEWIVGALDARHALERLCDGVDAVIHVAGAINAPTRTAFFAANRDGTAALLSAATRAGVGRFVQVSSLAAREPGLSDYGASKAAADELVTHASLVSCIVRPPAVYGPGDRETLALFRLVRRGLVPVIGAGRFSVIHVHDLADALWALAGSDVGGTFEVSDGAPLTQAGFARAIANAMGLRPRIVALPRRALALGAFLDTATSRLRGVRPKLSRDRARYLAHPDWIADPGPLLATGLWAPRVALDAGLAMTARWYAGEGWL